jgi:hypothetical protein
MNQGRRIDVARDLLRGANTPPFRDKHAIILITASFIEKGGNASRRLIQRSPHASEESRSSADRGDVLPRSFDDPPSAFRMPARLDPRCVIRSALIPDGRAAFHTRRFLVGTFVPGVMT